MQDYSGMQGGLGSLMQQWQPQSMGAPAMEGPPVQQGAPMQMPQTWQQFMPQLQQYFSSFSNAPWGQHASKLFDALQPFGAMMQPGGAPQQNMQPLPPQLQQQVPPQHMRPQQPQQEPQPQYGIGQATDFGGAAMASRGLTPSYLPSAMPGGVKNLKPGR